MLQCSGNDPGARREKARVAATATIEKVDRNGGPSTTQPVHETYRGRGNEAVRGVRDFTRLAQYQFARFEILCCYTICYYESVPGSQ